MTRKRRCKLQRGGQGRGGRSGFPPQLALERTMTLVLPGMSFWMALMTSSPTFHSEAIISRTCFASSSAASPARWGEEGEGGEGQVRDSQHTPLRQVRDSQHTPRESRHAPCNTRQTQHTPVVALASKASAVAEYLLQLAFAACSFHHTSLPIMPHIRNLHRTFSSQVS